MSLRTLFVGFVSLMGYVLRFVQVSSTGTYLRVHRMLVRLPTVVRVEEILLEISKEHARRGKVVFNAGKYIHPSLGYPTQLAYIPRWT